MKACVKSLTLELNVTNTKIYAVPFNKLNFWMSDFNPIMQLNSGLEIDIDRPWRKIYKICLKGVGKNGKCFSVSFSKGYFKISKCHFKGQGSFHVLVFVLTFCIYKGQTWEEKKLTDSTVLCVNKNVFLKWKCLLNFTYLIMHLSLMNLVLHSQTAPNEHK